MNENSPNPYLNETDLLESALRLATYPNDPGTQNAQILPGQIPDQLPEDIPIPKDYRILGSLIRNPEIIDRLLNAHLSPEQVLSFYRKILQAIGWQTTDIYRPNRGGLMPSGTRSQGGNETFYLGLRDPSLTIKDLESSAPGTTKSTVIAVALYSPSMLIQARET